MGITEYVISTTGSSYETAVRAYEVYCACYDLMPWLAMDMVVVSWLHYVIVSVGVPLQSRGCAVSRGVCGWAAVSSRVSVHAVDVVGQRGAAEDGTL